MLCFAIFAQAAPAAAAVASQEAAKTAETAPPEATSMAQSLAHWFERLWDMPGWVDLALARLILVVATLVVAWVGLIVVKYMILTIGRKVLEARLGKQSRRRARTLSELFYSISKYVIYFLAFVTALYQANVNPAPFLGGAAVIGLAVGFGSQGLVQDFVTGIFVLIENQFTIGEYVDLGGKTGVVVGMSVRMVTVRDDQGRLHNLPYRNIGVVTNFSRAGAETVFDVFLPDAAAERQAPKALEDLLSAFSQEVAPMVNSFSVAGLVNAGTPHALVRAKVSSRPNRADFIQAEVSKRITETFAAQSIGVKSVRAYSAPVDLV